MQRLRLVILAFGLLVIAFLLIMPEVDPPDAAGVEATSATIVVSWHVPTPVARKTTESNRSVVANDDRNVLSDSVELVQPDSRSSLTLLCLLRC
jgi:hypothetical protein